MATCTRTETELDDKTLKEEVEKAIGTRGVFCDGIDTFLNWFRTHVRDFFTKKISTLPIVGTWASRIGTTTSEFIITVVKTFFWFLKTVFTSSSVWKKAHEASMRAWTQNEKNGLLTQIYAYGKILS